ncbi:RNA polymerase II subunit A C-terminal domain phosphatase [Episyrphus balteatus]|uniref:RNA polymerase II subunit A C-terminal domain phosphatase n=1 Tax=Episyrphus balteatus TaxID=286459 RepID=UPI0024863DDB|nr:RNA polymerase II subunit A C-terminal domain phosphatase [Episyrphus balteatus]
MTDKNIEVFAPDDCKIKIIKWKVREGFPVNNSQVILVYEVCDSVNKEVKKLKSTKVGVVKKRLYKDGAFVEKGSALLSLSSCVHTTVIKDMCADCGADLRQNENGNASEASVPMVHSVPDLKVTHKLAQKLGQADTKRLLQDRKLVLLVDLDQTVIHTTNDNVPNNVKGIYHFQLYGPHSPWYHTRLRPGTAEFLKRMSQSYELHICTFGARNYAHMIAQLLDPDGNLFSHRILSRDECFNATSKTDNLKALFPCGDSMVCIIDDREDVWNMASNLIQVKPYHFFQHTGDINAPPGLSKHELDGKGVDFKDLKSATTDDENIDDNVATKDVPKSEMSQPVNEETTETNLEPSNVETVPKEEDEVSNINTVPKIEDDKEVEVNKVHTENISAEKNEFIDVTSNSPEENVKPLDGSQQIKIITDVTAKEIEIEDPDDYLLYLEVILKNIHRRFYEIYDETKEIPDLKIIVPKIRSEVLRNKNLVFSGLVPTNMKLEQSRAYFIAKSLGANVSQNISDATTHLVAVTSGTFKVNAAKKKINIKVVNANWLWSCAERWEIVDERLFPLDRKNKNKTRQPPAHCHSPEHVVNYSEKSEISTSSSMQGDEPEKFIDTINPLLSFSNADLADMNKEFDQFFESDSSTEDEHVNIENPPVDKTLRKRKRQEKEEERQREFFSREQRSLLVKEEHPENDEKSSAEDEDEMPSTKFRRGEHLPSDLDIGSESNDGSDPQDNEDDGDWNMMGAALEREFLGLDD